MLELSIRWAILGLRERVVVVGESRRSVLKTSESASPVTYTIIQAQSTSTSAQRF